jgi:hypothetical protein
MKAYVKTLLTLFFITAGYTAKAQVYQDLAGTPVKESKPADVEGSPYLSDTWTEGTVTTAKGTYKNVRLKYDMSSDQVVFASKNDDALAFADPVKEFTLTDEIFTNGFPPIGAQDKKSYYQVLAEGKIALLKRRAKHIQETKTYGSASVNREFVTINSYFVFKDNKIDVIKPDKKTIMALMTDKAEQMDAWVKANKVSFKSDEDLGKLFEYYNTLK